MVLLIGKTVMLKKKDTNRIKTFRSKNTIFWLQKMELLEKLH